MSASATAVRRARAKNRPKDFSKKRKSLATNSTRESQDSEL